MCFFKRLIYSTCSHALFLGPDPVRKCHLQLAYEDGQTAEPCGKMWMHSYTSLRVDGVACHKCAREQGTLRRTKTLLHEMRTRLLLPLDGNGSGGGGLGPRAGGAEEGELGRGRMMLLGGKRREGGRRRMLEEEEEEYGDESLSPVKLRFSSGSSSSGAARAGEDGSVSSFSLEGAALSAVGVDD